MSIGRWGFVLGLVLCTEAAGSSANRYFAEQVLPIAVDSGTYRSEIYIDALDMGAASDVFQVTYYGGADTSAPGRLDCGQKVIGPHPVKFSLRDLCPALPAGSQYGMLSLSTVGVSVGTDSPARLRVYARVQNYQGIGFSVEGIPPQTAVGETYVIGLKNNLDANGVRHQVNCFVGLFPENRAPNPGPQPATASFTLFQAGNYKGSTTVPLMHGGLTRVLDVFAAANQPLAYQENISIRVWVNGGGQLVDYFAFCTQQENGNFSADFRLAAPQENDAYTAGQIIQADGRFGTDLTLVGSEVAVFRPQGWRWDSMNCWVDSSKMWVRIGGYYDTQSPPMASETGRVRHQEGLYFGSGEVEVGLKPGEATATGFLMCNSGKGFPGLVRVK